MLINMRNMVYDVKYVGLVLLCVVSGSLGYTAVGPCACSRQRHPPSLSLPLAVLKAPFISGFREVDHVTHQVSMTPDRKVDR